VARQTDTLDRLGHGSRVAIIRLRSLGDCVLTTPAIQMLKQARPDLQIGVVVEDRFAPIFGEAALGPRAAALRSFGPELCLNLHGGTRSSRLTLLSGARFRAGFDIFRPGWIYNTPIPTAQETMGITRRVHTAEHLASAIFYLGAPLGEVPRAHVPAGPGRSSVAPEGRYAVIHALAATPEKTWPSENFLALAQYLEKSLGLQVVFIGGLGEDLTRFSAHRAVAGAPLGEIAKLMRDAVFFAGNDSGPAHVAAAFGVPQVVLFGPSDSEVWAPWRTAAEIVKADGAMADIPVARVMEAVDRLLAPMQVTQ
jgi:heptosyltransferase III